MLIAAFGPEFEFETVAVSVQFGNWLRFSVDPQSDALDFANRIFVVENQVHLLKFSSIQFLDM